MRLVNLVCALLLAGCLTGCQGDPWTESFVPLGPAATTGTLGAGPIEKTDLLLVDFDKATRDRAEPGHRAVGYANFTGTYSRRVERQLRDFAASIGADFVAWGAMYMHSERHTSYETVFDTYTSRTRGRRYDPRTGSYDDADRTRTTTVTRTVPVVNDDAIYAFRAVFYRSADGSGAAADSSDSSGAAGP